jgi:hypothetical protein
LLKTLVAAEFHIEDTRDALARQQLAAQVLKLLDATAERLQAHHHHH